MIYVSDNQLFTAFSERIFLLLKICATKSCKITKNCATVQVPFFQRKILILKFDFSQKNQFEICGSTGSPHQSEI
jgi:hypothetical protein